CGRWRWSANRSKHPLPSVAFSEPRLQKPRRPATGTHRLMGCPAKRRHLRAVAARRSFRSRLAAESSTCAGGVGWTSQAGDARCPDGLDKLVNTERPDDLIAVLLHLASRDSEVFVRKRKKLAGIDHQAPALPLTIDIAFNERELGGHRGTPFARGNNPC